MKYCQFCNSKLVETKPYCPMCGRAVPVEGIPNNQQAGLKVDSGIKHDLSYTNPNHTSSWNNNSLLEKILVLGGVFVGVLALTLLVFALIKAIPPGLPGQLSKQWVGVIERLVPDKDVQESVALTTTPKTRVKGCSRSLEKCFVDYQELASIFGGDFAEIDNPEVDPSFDFSQYKVTGFSKTWEYHQDEKKNIQVKIILANMESAVFSRPAYVSHFVEQFGIRWKGNHTGELASLSGEPSLPGHSWLFEGSDGHSVVFGTSHDYIAVFMKTVSNGYTSEQISAGLTRLGAEQITILEENDY